MDMIIAFILICVSFTLLWVYRHIEEVAVSDPFITEDSERELWRVNLVVAISGSTATLGSIWMVITLFMSFYGF